MIQPVSAELAGVVKRVGWWSGVSRWGCPPAGISRGPVPDRTTHGRPERSARRSRSTAKVSFIPADPAHLPEALSQAAILLIALQRPRLQVDPVNA